MRVHEVRHGEHIGKFDAANILPRKPRISAAEIITQLEAVRRPLRGKALNEQIEDLGRNPETRIQNEHKGEDDSLTHRDLGSVYLQRN